MNNYHSEAKSLNMFKIEKSQTLDKVEILTIDWSLSRSCQQLKQTIA